MQNVINSVINSCLVISGIIGAIASMSYTESAFADPIQLRQVLQTRICEGCDLSREKLVRDFNFPVEDIHSVDLDYV